MRSLATRSLTRADDWITPRPDLIDGTADNPGDLRRNANVVPSTLDHSADHAARELDLASDCGSIGGMELQFGLDEGGVHGVYKLALYVYL